MQDHKQKLIKETYNKLDELDRISYTEHKMWNLDRITISEIEIMNSIFQELLEYKTGILRNDNINDKLLGDIIKICKHAFTFSEPGIHRDIKIRCQRILNTIGGY